VPRRSAIIALCLLSSYALAQETFYNWTVLRLWRGGANQSYIIDQIRLHPEQYALSPDDMRDLAELPPPVIDAMRSKHGLGSSTAAAPAAVLRNAAPAPSPVPVQPQASPAPPPAPSFAAPAPAIVPSNAPSAPPADYAAASTSTRTDMTVRVRRGANWLTVPAEQMAWQTHGMPTKVRNAFLKVPTAGIVGRPIKATVDGEHSRVLAPTPLDMIIDVPAGSSTQNYLLVELQMVKGQRKFEVGGSKTHGSHKSLPFYLQKIQTTGVWDQYRVELQDYMQGGEYGLFDVRSVYNSRGGSSQVANIYTFSMP